MLHIAAINQNVPSTEELLKSWPEASLYAVITSRNLSGETPLSIAIAHKNEKLVKLLQDAANKVGDVSKQTSQDFLDELENEEEQKAKKKEKEKQRKQKSKLSKIAEKVGLSVEELQARHHAENE